MSTGYNDVNLGPVDNGYLYKIVQNHTDKPLEWAPYAAAVIWLAERTGAFKLIYDMLPRMLSAAMRSDGIAIYPSHEYYDALRYTASGNYDHLFAYSKNASYANVLEDDREKIEKRIETELYAAMVRFYSAFQNGPQTVPNSLYAESAKTINYLFRGALAPAAMAMAFDAMKVKHIINSPALSKTMDTITAEDKQAIERQILSKLPADYDQLETALVCTFKGVCSGSWSDDTRESNLERFHEEHISPVWKIVL